MEGGRLRWRQGKPSAKTKTIYLRNNPGVRSEHISLLESVHPRRFIFWLTNVFVSLTVLEEEETLGKDICEGGENIQG
jgi:hypothetical protein